MLCATGSGIEQVSSNRVAPEWQQKKKNNPASDSLTVHMWHIAMATPIVNGTEPPISVLPESTAENTVITNTKVIINSIPNPCPGSKNMWCSKILG